MAISCEEVEGAFDKGRMYERYRKKREAKLREDWFRRMQHKEAQIHATWQSLEQSRPSDCSLSPVQNTQQMTESIREETKTQKTISRRNSFKKPDLGQNNTVTISLSTSRPQTRQENRAPVSKNTINNSSLSSPNNLSRSRTVNTESKQNKLLIKTHKRSNTLTGPINFEISDLENNSDSDSTRKGRVTKPFLKKGSGIAPGLGPSILKQRASVKNEERFLDCNFESGDDLSLNGSELSDSVRERKKWVVPEKLEIFSSEKEEMRLGFKRLMLNIVGKSKNRDSLVC